MSTELRRFRRLCLVVCCTLALAAGTLGALGLARGPDLAGAAISVERAVSLAGERLVLRTLQPLAEVLPSQVEVRPAAPFTISTKGEALTVRFTSPLAYGTTYEVLVRGLHSLQTPQTADWRYTFATPSANLYTLLAQGNRGGSAEPDQVLVTEGAHQRQVLSAPTISEYVVTRHHVIAISNPDETSSELLAAERVDPSAEPSPPLAAAPALALLRVTESGDRFGYTATGTEPSSGRELDNVLFVHDANDLPKQPMEVTSGGKPLAVQDWLFVPGVAAVVALDLEGKASLIYLNGDAPPTSLGSYNQLHGFLPGTTTLVATKSGREQLLDLTTGKGSPLASVGGLAKEEFSGRRTQLTPKEAICELNRVDRSGDGSRLVTRLAMVGGNRAKTLLKVTPATGQLLDSGVSSNGRYAWAEVLDPDAPLEDLTSGASDRVTTRVFGLPDGDQVAAVRGGRPVWAIT